LINSSNYIIKPVFDFIFSILILPVVLPIIFLFWVLLLIPNKGKVFFIQPRTGKNGEKFKIIKFRTLIGDKNAIQKNKLRYFLRENHFDEMPQIFNVILGNMSLVGPRPLLPEYNQYYDSKSVTFRDQVKPGITGLTQISGGKYLFWSRRFSLDLFYIHHATFFFDIFIIYRTLNILLKKTQKPNPIQFKNDISYIDYINGRINR
jgi:undecaprenyl phosphate N,N'-diacetylbacillosamine 1-phosphate transferase